jgi:hypothetical protein
MFFFFFLRFSQTIVQSHSDADAVDSWLRKVNFLLLEKQGLDCAQHCKRGEGMQQTDTFHVVSRFERQSIPCARLGW